MNTESWLINGPMVNDFPMKKIRSISTAGKVIAHVNEAFGDGEEIATLIAAAPDLLAALLDVATMLDNFAEYELGRRMRAFYPSILAALAKAGA